MIEWIPSLTGKSGPRYLEIVTALEGDISAGLLTPGTRLLPHRDMAERLGISVGTVSKAFAEAEKRGLISGEVGRGTFVLGKKPEPSELADGALRGRINLALNAPPATGEDRVIEETLGEILRTPGIGDLMGYLPHQGIESHRTTIARWLARHGMPANVHSLLITHGAQHAISIALSILLRNGDTVLAENLTYSGMVALAGHANYDLRGVSIDAHGLVPEQLDRAFHETGARVVYCMPTLQTPTGTTMPDARREEIVEIVRRHDAYLIEDDAYGFLCDPPVAPLAARLPERSFYVVSFAKCLSPGLRIGALHTPSAFRDRCINAIRSTCWMAPPLMAEAVVRLIANGGLEAQIAEKRETARRRFRIVERILGDRIFAPEPRHPAYHVWLQMPAGRTTTALIAQAAMSGVTLAAPNALQAFDALSNGVRLCLGGPRTDAEVEYALQTVRDILDNAETMSFV